MARQGSIYIGHKDLLAVVYSRNLESPFLELYISHEQYMRMEKIFREQGAPKEISMANSECCPEGYVTFSYDGASEMSKIAKVLSDLTLLNSEQEKEIMEHCPKASVSLRLGGR